MKSLGVLKFFVNNKRKTFIIFSSIFIGVFVISIITVMISGMFSTVEKANEAPYKSFSLISGTSGDVFINSEVVDELNKIEEIDKFYNVFIENTTLKTVFGTCATFVLYINNEDELKAVFENCNLKLIEGHMPFADKYEIIMHKDMLKNRGLKVGDKFGNKVDKDEAIRGEYTIVGSFEGECVISFGSKNIHINSLESRLKDESGENYIDILLLPKKDQLENMNDKISNLKFEDINIVSLTKVKETLKEEMENVHSVMSAIFIFVIIGLSISIASLIFSIYGNRKDEFGILFCIGYNKKFIYNKIFGELLFVSIISWFLGYIASMGISKIMDILIFAPIGQKIAVFTTESIIYTLIVPAIVFIFGFVPCSYNLSKTDLVSVIERRN